MVVPPDSVQQLAAVKDDTRPAHHKFQQSEFRGRERYRIPIVRYPASAPIQFQRPEPYDSNRPFLGSTELNIHTSYQLADGERLHDVIVRSHLQSSHPIGFGPPGREKNDRSPGDRRVVSQPRTDL